MTTDQEQYATRVSGNGQLAEAVPRVDLNRPAQAEPRSRKKPFILALILVVATLIGWAVYHRSHSNTTASAGLAGARDQSVAVPVVEGIVATKDVPIYLDGLGTVQAFNTVTVRARVDGQLMKVAFTEGQDVKAGDVLVQLDPAPYQAALGQAVAKKAQDAAQLDNARVDLQRYADLLKTDSITQQIYDTQKALLAQLEATVKADQAAVDSARVNLDYTTIRSPIEGRVGIRQVDVGNIVHASDSNGLVVLTQLRPISVVFTLPEQVLSKLHDNQTAESDYTVLAVSRENTKVLAEGKLAVIDNQIDTTTGTIKLKATFANENLLLWPGQFINTRLLLTTLTNGAIVPASVVQRGPDGAFAFVIQADATVEMRTIKVTQIEAGEALIASGLTPGERVVVDGQYKLQPGSHVKPAQSLGNSGAAGRESSFRQKAVNISEPFIKRPVATSLLMVGVLLMGLLGYYLLPISALPPVDFPTIQVVAQYPGASPDVMASSVTTPLERQFGQISGLATMTSVSSFANATITLQFTLDRDIDAASQDVQAAINAAGGVLPRGMPNPPTYNKVNPADTPILTLALTSDTLPLEKVNDLADTTLAQKLSEVTGVGLVTIEGNQKPAVRVRVNPAAIASLGLSLEDVRSAVIASSVNAPKGSFDGARQSYAINANDQIFSAADYRNVIVAYRNGSPVRVADIGEAVDNVENVRMASWVGSQPAVLLDIQRQPGANIIQTADQVKALLTKLRAALPTSVKLSIFGDRTETIRASVADVQLTLLLTVALVVMVIFVFLRKFWATVIPSIALPLTLIATFGVMKLVGFSLDNLSLMALTISTGFVVDDAIVMIENIVRHIEAGDWPLEAALKGAKQIGFTIVSLSVSLVAVFIPLLFMTGIVGRLFREFAITLSVAVAVSALISLTLTPMMCARLLRPESEAKHGRFFQFTERFFKGMLDVYDRSLQWVLRHQRFTLAVAAATLVATVLLYVFVPKGLLPQQDTGLIIAVTDAAQSISFKAMVERQREIAEIARRDPDVQSVASFVGAGTVNATVNSGRLYINLKPRDKRGADAQQIIRRLSDATVSVQGISLFMQAAQDVQIDSRISRTQYQYTLEDADRAELADWAAKLLAKLRTEPELADVASDQQPNGLQVSVTVDREKASRLNILPQAIDDTLYDAFGQRQVATIFTQLNQYRVVLEVDPQFQQAPASLEKIYVKSTTGQMIPLTTFATVQAGTAPLSIVHEGQFPAVTLSFNLAPGKSLGEAVVAINRATKQIGLPDTVATSFSGSAAEFRSSLASEPFLILAAIVVIYIVLGVLYESYIHPLTILSSLPSAGVGALLAMIVCRDPLSLISLIGIILLIGIVKKNAIMMIDFALEAERVEKLSPEKSIYQACLLRFRPIMMTTMAALLGALPLALEQGNGSELRRPLGISIVGGLLISQFLTLYTTPVIYLYLDRLSTQMRKWRVTNAGEPELAVSASSPVALQTPDAP